MLRVKVAPNLSLRQPSSKDDGRFVAMADARSSLIRDVYSKLRALRGKVRFDLDLKQLRADRR